MKKRKPLRNKLASSKKNKAKITDYDNTDTSTMIDPSQNLRFEDLGITLPDTPPTQVVSIRLPTQLLNKLRSLGSQMDIPYQALIKQFLFKAVGKL